MRRMLLLAVMAGCSDSGSSTEPVSHVDLRAAIGAGDVDPVGVAVAPDGGRFVFDQARGLIRIDGDGATIVMPMAALPTPGPDDAPLNPPITDLVALAPDVFALTAIGDGYLLDTHAMTLQQHFCYLPGGDTGDGSPAYFTQRTDALAYDALADRIYAQPQTRDDQGVLQYTQLVAYDGTGADVEWYGTPTEIQATGMVVMPDGSLVLAQGATLYSFDKATTAVAVLADLSRYGISSIDGLAIDPAAHTLLVVDRAADALVELALDSLRL